jgi:predicted ATPase
VEQGLEVVHNTKERVYEPELWRLKGELLLHHSQEQEAETAFFQAINVAHSQQAKSWELRATTNLGRLWQKQGKIAEAYRLLSTIYSWFTEGFETSDLVEARALLAELEVEK